MKADFYLGIVDFNGTTFQHNFVEVVCFVIVAGRDSHKGFSPFSMESGNDVTHHY